MSDKYILALAIRVTKTGANQAPHTKHKRFVGIITPVYYSSRNPGGKAGKKLESRVTDNSWSERSIPLDAITMDLGIADTFNYGPYPGDLSGDIFIDAKIKIALKKTEIVTGIVKFVTLKTISPLNLRYKQEGDHGRASNSTTFRRYSGPSSVSYANLTAHRLGDPPN